MANLNLSFSFATVSPTSSAHPVCHAPVNKEDGLGSGNNVTKTLWLKLSWWSWVEQGIAQRGVADGTGTGDRSMAWKAASLSSGLLTYAGFSVLACLPRTPSPEVLTKKKSSLYRTLSSIRKLMSIAYLLVIGIFQPAFSVEVSTAAKLLWRELPHFLLKCWRKKSFRRKCLNAGKEIFF